MLTETEKNLLLTLDYFVRHGSGNIISLSRRDVVCLVDMMRRIDGEKPVLTVVTETGAKRTTRLDHDACTVCGQPFTKESPARFIVRGKGKVHYQCRDAAGGVR